MAIAAKKKREDDAVLFQDGLKRCTVCFEIKPIDSFHKAKRKKSVPFSAMCKECDMSRHAVWSSCNTEHLRGYAKARRDDNPAKYAEEARLANENGRSSISPRYVLNRLAKNAVRRWGSENPITTDHLIWLFETQRSRCALSGILLTWGPGYASPTSMSLDRIDPDHGYSIGNVRLVCYAVNAFRHRMSDAEMLCTAKAIVTNMEYATPEPFAFVV